jgi:hypothetical protein
MEKNILIDKKKKKKKNDKCSCTQIKYKNLACFQVLVFFFLLFKRVKTNISLRVIICMWFYSYSLFFFRLLPAESRLIKQ